MNSKAINKKWLIGVKIDDPKTYMSKKEQEKYITDITIEMSVLRADNKLGKKSWGWKGFDKLIIFDDVLNSDETDNDKIIEWMVKVTETIAIALNKANL